MMQNFEIMLQRKHWQGSAHLTLLQSSFEALLQAQDSFLNTREQSRLNHFATDKRKYQYLLGRFCAKQCLMQETPHTLKDITIASGVFRQPIVHPHTLAKHVSIAHSYDLGGALAFPSSHPMGLDIEMITSEKAAVIQSQMTKQDLETLRILDEQYALTLGWTVKEALSKVLNCGLMVPFTLLEIATCQQKAEIIECTFHHFRQYRSHSWQMGKFIITLVLPKNTQVVFKLRE